MLAEQAESPVNADARALLTGKGIVVEGIVRVDPDAILYLGLGSRPCTAWLCHRDNRVEIVTQAGWEPYPPADCFEQQQPESD